MFQRPDRYQVQIVNLTVIHKNAEYPIKNHLQAPQTYGYQATQGISVFYALIRIQVSPGNSGNVKLLSCVQLFATPWTVAYQAPPSMEFSKQQYWTGLLFPSPGDLPDPGTKPTSPTLAGEFLPLSQQGNL